MGAYIALFIALAFVPTIIGDDVFLSIIIGFEIRHFGFISELVGDLEHFEPRYSLRSWFI